MVFVEVDPKRLIQREGVRESTRFFSGLPELQNPAFNEDGFDWRRWRIAYAGGHNLLFEFLEKFSTREKESDFNRRKRMSPVANFAKTAINNIRNGIFQRMTDVTRKGGTPSYSESMKGEKGGVDRRNTPMNTFMGQKVLTDLLLMGKVGIYVDAPEGNNDQVTQSDVINNKPYVYMYALEDIVAFSINDPGHPSQFRAILFRDTEIKHDDEFLLPVRQTHRFRWVRLNEKGKVVSTFFSVEGEKLETRVTDLERIPFILIDAGGSVMKDVLQHQIAILNIDSANTNYAMLQNFPKWVEKRSGYGIAEHMKDAANSEGTATTGGQAANEEQIEFGEVMGRTYAEEAPQYVSPPSDTLLSNMELSKKYEADINKLAHQAISNLATSADDPFESGLAYLGNLIQDADNRVAEFWAIYEESTKIATIDYPDRWNLKSEAERMAEAKSLSELIFAVPGTKIKKALAQQIALSLFSGRISNADMDRMLQDIDDAPYTTSDPAILKIASELGYVGTKTGSLAFGFEEGEHVKAEEDHTRRLERIKEAQTSEELTNPAARGVKDEAVVPGEEASNEKEISRETDQQPTPQSRVRTGAND